MPPLPSCPRLCLSFCSELLNHIFLTCLPFPLICASLYVVAMPGCSQSGPPSLCLAGAALFNCGFSLLEIGDVWVPPQWRRDIPEDL